MRLAQRIQVLVVVSVVIVGIADTLLAQVQTGISFHQFSSAEESIRNALSQPTSFPNSPANEEPLSKFASRLSDRLGFNVVLDTKALEGAGVATDTPVRSRIRNVRLVSGLNLVLRDLTLTWVIRNDSLLITTNEEAENTLEIRVYPVSDLVAFDEKVRQVEDFEPLMDILKSTTGVPKPGWVDDGGVGTVKGFPGGRLVCSQTFPVHVEIEGVLAGLRLAQKVQGNTPIIYERKNPLSIEENVFADSPRGRGRVSRHTRRNIVTNTLPAWMAPQPDRGDE